MHYPHCYRNTIFAIKYHAIFIMGLEGCNHLYMYLTSESRDYPQCFRYLEFSVAFRGQNMRDKSLSIDLCSIARYESALLNL